MKRYWTLTLIGLILAIAIPVALKVLPRPLPDSQCSDLYLRYANTPGIQASFVKGFPLNDTLSIDATLLHATDSSAWLQLAKELKLPKPMAPIVDAMKKGENVPLTYLAKKGSTAHQMDTNLANNDVVGISYLYQTIAIYHPNSPDDLIPIAKYSFFNTPKR